MRNPRLATRYAKSLLDLAKEKSQVDAVYNDMEYLQALCSKSREFVTLLRSPIITADKKEVIIKAVTKGRIGELTNAFVRLLVNKGREEHLPEISAAFVTQYNKLKGIYIIKLTTATPVSDEVKKQIVAKVQSQTNMQNIELQAEVKEDIIGGFLLEIGDTLVDASIAYDLNKIRSQFMNNDFIYRIR